MTGWAKAPDFADRPEHREQVRAQTVLDKEHYMEAGMTPIACQSCGTEVLVRKHSSNQKTVQWRTNPADSCPVFQKLSANGPVFGKPDSCPSLEKTIDHAVAEGILEIDQ
ncbi:hypothetical protein D7D52_04515 [Nocardia yunnanensis]|uniref:Ferredoxin n=1 Tax=Nocardia yunnanensis TaxID=2382165 RepID=A0A386Z9G8_9NOCA|nr:hypothetical protein [Nocardia yunnanensis]AYF73245.1 hypothetical protein D7D52_04515 [Nocardia yunnanensis]